MATNNQRAVSNKPNSAQLEAIRRLARDDKIDDARARLNDLLHRFPGFRPLLALAWEIEDEAGSPWKAAVRAFDWTQASPASEAALEALCGAAFASDLAALGTSASMRLAQLKGGPAQDLPDMQTPFGSMTIEEAAKADISRMLLIAERYDEIIDRLKGVMHSAVCNNRAMAYFAKGDVARALEEFESNWQRHPENLFALKHVIQLRIWQRNCDYAAGLSAHLAATVPLRGEDALSKVHAFMLLDRWTEAEASWQAESTADYWLTQNQDLRGIFDYSGAVIALRNGDLLTAKERLPSAENTYLDAASMPELAQAVSIAPESSSCFVQVGGFDEWFPNTWYRRLIDLHGTRQIDADKTWQQHLATCDAQADYLGLAVELGGQRASHVARTVLKHRAEQGDLVATNKIISLLKRPGGTDSMRLFLMNWLTEKKLIASDAVTPVFINGKIKEMKTLSFYLTSERTQDIPYPPAVQKRYEAMTELLHKRRLKEALALAREICRLHPEVPMSHANVAFTMESMGHDNDEIEPLFHRALTLNQDYLFARAGLARILATRGDIEAAKTMLQPVYAREKYHVAEWRMILLTQRAIALAEGNTGALQGIDRSLRNLEEMAV